MRTYGPLHGPYSPYGFRPRVSGDHDPAEQAPIPTAAVVAMLAICVAVVLAIAILSPGTTDPGSSPSRQAATSSFTR